MRSVFYGSPSNIQPQEACLVRLFQTKGGFDSKVLDILLGWTTFWPIS